MRKAITSLQSCARLKSSGKITENDVYEVTGIVPESWLSKFIDACKSSDINQIMHFIDELTLEAFSAHQVEAK